MLTDWAYRSKINFFLYESVEFTGKPLTEGGLRLGYIFTNGKYEVAAFGRNIIDTRRITGGDRLQQPDRLHQRAAHGGRPVQGQLLSAGDCAGRLCASIAVNPSKSRERSRLFSFRRPLPARDYAHRIKSISK